MNALDFIAIGLLCALVVMYFKTQNSKQKVEPKGNRYSVVEKSVGVLLMCVDSVELIEDEIENSSVVTADQRAMLVEARQDVLRSLSDVQAKVRAYL